MAEPTPEECAAANKAWADYLRSLGWTEADIKLATGVECTAAELQTK